MNFSLKVSSLILGRGLKPSIIGGCEKSNGTGPAADTSALGSDAADVGTAAMLASEEHKRQWAHAGNEEVHFRLHLDLGRHNKCRDSFITQREADLQLTLLSSVSIELNAHDKLFSTTWNLNYFPKCRYFTMVKGKSKHSVSNSTTNLKYENYILAEYSNALVREGSRSSRSL